MVDSIKNVPLYQNIYTIVSMVLGGYYDTEYVEWGPYYKLLSFNKQEGCRFQLGARTTTDFSKKIRLFGYGAYGTKDRRWKGAGGFDYPSTIYRLRSYRLLSNTMSCNWERESMRLPKEIS